MIPHGQFSIPLTFRKICQRVREARAAYVPTVLMVFLAAYILDKLLGVQLGLPQFMLVGWTGLLVLAWISIVELKDITINRWEIFYLRLDEIIFARNKDGTIVVRKTEEIRDGALKGCRDMYLLSIKPWRHRLVSAAIDEMAIHLSVSLEFHKIDPSGVQQWLRYSAEDMVDIIQLCCQEAVKRLGKETILQSAYLLEKVVEDEVTSKYLGITGMAIDIDLLEVQERQRMTAHG